MIHIAMLCIDTFSIPRRARGQAFINTAAQGRGDPCYTGSVEYFSPKHLWTRGGALCAAALFAMVGATQFSEHGIPGSAGATGSPEAGPQCTQSFSEDVFFVSCGGFF